MESCSARLKFIVLVVVFVLFLIMVLFCFVLFLFLFGLVWFASFGSESTKLEIMIRVF